MNYNYILPALSPDLARKVNNIENIIKSSQVNFKQYFIYISDSSALSKSQSEDDWSFCILILKFLSSDEEFDDLFSILNWFLYRYRYRDKFIKHDSYVSKTIKKVICFALKSSLIGSSLDKVQVRKICSRPISSSSNSYKSIDRNHVIKVCNILNIFSMDSKPSAFINPIIDYSNNPDNYLKISSQDSNLNHFDLTIFLAILHQYKNSNLYTSFKLDVASILKLIGYDTGYSRRKLLSSLKKLSTTNIECRKQYLKFATNDLKSPDDYFYSFCGNLLSFEALSSKKMTSINIQISLPLIRIFDADNYYALINWQIFTSLPTTKLRLLYFYFCLNVKVSVYFTEFSIKSIVNVLYSASSSSNVRFFSAEVRKMFLFFIKHKNMFIDFEFDPIINHSYNTIHSLKVRRSKLILI
uniref:Uncharacterized protein n=1 Tax=Gracilaria vermiculophylla TaxID=2608709 RepID=A0A346Q012_9FLOR|nr:hypothetical protein [Gracilaria vermiculophylla]